MKYLFTNVLGSFMLDNGKIIDNIMFNDQEFVTKETYEKKLRQKYPDSKPLPPEQLFLILELFKDKKYYPSFYRRNVLLTKEAIKHSVNEDQLIIQAIANINELDKTTNLLVKRLREWYSLYLPELSEKIFSHEKFTKLVLEKPKEELLQELELKEEESMGADVAEVHVQEIKRLAEEVEKLFKLRKTHEHYLEQVMLKYCPNLLEMAGVTIGAKLLELARSLRNLALLPASTIQLLGAEKALFRHIKTGSRSPKHGIIIHHPFVQKAKEKGKAARMLADKISLCARLDYFKGEFKAPEYRKELEERLHDH